jgi:hypothetical protein
MQSFPNLDQLIPSDWTQLAYQTLQDGKAAFGLLDKTLKNRLTDLFLPDRQKKTTPLSAELTAKLQTLRKELFAVEWEDAQAGVYPVSLLFDNEWENFLRYYPALWLDLPNVWQTVKQKKYQNFSPDIDLEGYPAYYLQNFHYQTDGYLGEM